MKMMMRWMLLAVAIAAVNSQFTVQSHASLFKIDFGQLQNEREILDADGNPTGTFPEVLKDWDIIGTWTFEDPAGNGGKGAANADHTAVTWNLTDWSQDKEADVTLTIIDNKALAEQLNPETPPYMLGQTANNPVPQGVAAVYDGVLVPAVVKDDYLYRAPDTAGSEVLMRFSNLNPGTYNVTVFEGRTSDSNGRFGKVWVDDIKGTKEPAAQNTGNYSGVNLDVGGVAVPLGQPRTITVNIKAGEYLWFAEMEDNTGGISGIIIRSVPEPIVVKLSDSKGLFKIDFGQLQNEREDLDADGNPTGTFPEVLKDWTVIPTWTFSDPAANVTPGSASAVGTANAEGTEATWKLTDFSKDANKNVTMTIMDNVALSESLGLGAPSGQTANNPVPALLDVIYDGVLVPAIVKDDYLYRSPDTAGTELLMRFAGLNPGTYNVTVFEGRTSDGNGRFGKVWVDDIKGTKEPAVQNTGNYSGVNLDVGGVATPVGQPRTITVNIKAGEYLWFAEMEDNTGGISGMIIRGIGDSGTVLPGPITDGLKAYWTFDGNLNDSIKVFHGTARGTTPIAFVDGKAGFGKSIKLDGGNQFVEITGGSEDDLEFPGRSMSIAGWFKVDAFDTEWQALIAKGEGSNYRVARRASTGTIAYAGGVGEGANDVPTVNDGQWHHFVAISDATGAQFGTALYVDGVIHGINRTRPALAANNARLMIGENPEARGREWEGQIDDIAIWNRVLTPTEITTLYNGGAGTPLQKLAGLTPPITLTVAKTAGGIAITYTGTLQAADAVTGPYTDVTGAASPYSAATTSAAKYFRARQ